MEHVCITTIMSIYPKLKNSVVACSQRKKEKLVQRNTSAELYIYIYLHISAYICIYIFQIKHTIHQVQ